jgi:hypothetical protein
MKKATALLASGLLLSSLAGVASAITLDGTAEAGYGAPIAVQTVGTGFGDSNLGATDYANGSELDGVYASISGGTLYLLLAGNVESNYNKLEVYFDTKAGGQNVLRADNPNVDFDGLNRQSGLKFDAGFSPDYYITFGGGYDGSGYRLFANYAELLTAGGGNGYYLGSNTAVTNAVLGGGTNPDNIGITINNSNTAGVNGTNGGASSGAGVTTGAEFAIPLSAIGNPTGCFTVCAFINGSGHDYLANQVLGGLPVGTGNLGDPHNVDFSQIAGNQYFSVCGQATPTHTTTWGQLKTSYR